MTKKVESTTYQVQNSNYSRYNYKITPSDEKEIILQYFFNRPSACDYAVDKFKISPQRFYQIVNKHKKNNFAVINEDIARTRENFNKRTTAIIEKALDQIENKLEQGEDVNLSQLATLTGILYDKQALSLGQSTNNSAVNISIKVDK